MPSYTAKIEVELVPAARIIFQTPHPKERVLKIEVSNIIVGRE